MHLFLQVVQQAAGPQQHPGLGTPGSVAHAPAARQLDPQVQAPGPGHTPVAMPAAPRGTALAKPAISWASVVQVKIAASELLRGGMRIACNLSSLRGKQVVASILLARLCYEQ